MLETPVLLLIFNRPDNTHQVFEAIRKARPKHLFIVADGPRDGKDGEEELCRQTRMVASQVDWDCEVETNFSDVNLGCKIRVSSGITWVFEQVEEAIILEDDCVPDASFFQYCETMLDRYRNDTHVMHIAGVNFQGSVNRGAGSYYFSKYPHIWGWATWKRAWKTYDVTLSEWPAFKASGKFQEWCYDKKEQTFWGNALQNVYDGKVDTWDYQWFFNVISRGGYCLMPNVNLITNIGFRSDATHTHEYNPKVADLPTQEYVFPDSEVEVAINKDADEYTYENVFKIPKNVPDEAPEASQGRSIFTALKSKLSSMFSSDDN